MSRNPRTAAAGGLLPKFSLATTNVPDNFKQAAFTLNEGQVSDAVFADGAFHLIKLEQKLAPRAVKFEGVKESLRAKVREQIILNGVALLRDKLLDQTRAALKIEDPVLREQFARGLEKRQQQMRKENEELVLGPNLWAGIGKARIGVGTALVGSGANVAARLQEYVDAGICTFILSGYPHLEEAQRFGRYVMPHFVGQRSEPEAVTA